MAVSTAMAIPLQVHNRCTRVLMIGLLDPLALVER
jgi:hypothetical protein